MKVVKQSAELIKFGAVALPKLGAPQANRSNLMIIMGMNLRLMLLHVLAVELVRRAPG
jgi:hypothetical protein